MFYSILFVSLFLNLVVVHEVHAETETPAKTEFLFEATDDDTLKAIIDRVSKRSTLGRKPYYNGGQESAFSTSTIGGGLMLRTGTYTQAGFNFSTAVTIGPEYYGDKYKHALIPVTAGIDASLTSGQGQNFTQAVGPVGGNVSIQLHPAVLYTPIEIGDDGINFTAGASARLRGLIEMNGVERGSTSGAVMSELGVYVKKDRVSLMLTGSLQIGGESCTANLPGVSPEFTFRTRGLSYGGVARLFVGDRFAFNAIYAYYPASDAVATQFIETGKDGKQIESKTKPGGMMLRVLAVYNVNEKVSLTGSCDLTQWQMHTYADNKDRSWDRTFATVGLAKKFGQKKKSKIPVNNGY